jgi:FkbM family methyltransferase
MAEPIFNILTNHILESGMVNDRFRILHGGSVVTRAVMRWDEGIPANRLTVYGFEADQDRARKSGATRSKEEAERHVIDHALWHEDKDITLHVSETLGASSMFAHDFDEIGRWRNFNLGADTEKLTVKAVRADSWATENSISDLDFTYLNVEGAELSVLQGMTNIIEHMVGAVVEVNFIPTYFKGAPVFSDVDVYMRRIGFSLFGFLPHFQFVGRNRSPVDVLNAPATMPSVNEDLTIGRQIFQSKAIYFRDLPSNGSLASFPVEKVLKLACLAELYGQIEFAFEVAVWCAESLETKSPEQSRRLTEAVALAAKVYHTKPNHSVAEEEEPDEVPLSTEELLKLHDAHIERMQGSYTALLKEHLKATGVLTGDG